MKYLLNLAVNLGAVGGLILFCAVAAVAALAVPILVLAATYKLLTL